MKKYWRCHVCNDIHFGIKSPEICPTCLQENAYVEVSSLEALKVMSVTESRVDKDAFTKAIQVFAAPREFQVNSDQERVNLLLEGMFNNLDNHGLKYCPCRMIEKDFEKDLTLVCPCNFLTHDTYKDKEHGECWCGLFIKRRHDE
ncbi:MAG: ferredoxin-thioredoxin reductase catalytic domain-containing protein [Candidatus Aminicenantaceae bacterium]